MARPFPTTFDADSPMTPQSAASSSIPISYRADVNRTKTKKWTQAAAVDYGGDDWGDEDDYGYGYEPPPPPLPASKPTGLRQQGQRLQNQPVNEQSSVDNKNAYGQLQSIPSAQNNARGRANSFDEGEERNFSNATVVPPTTNSASAAPPATKPGGPATRFSQITGSPSRDPRGPPLSVSTQPGQTTGLRKANPVISPIPESTQPDVPIESTETYQTGSVPTSADTRTPSSGYQARRDFSPSAVPQPLSTRDSPAPQAPRDRSTSATRFPGRKSSLSQAAVPDLTTTLPHSEDATTHKPWAASGRSASPSVAPTSPASPSTGKNLPFIRPSDIYKRAAEEERLSMESGRPSMDSLAGGRESLDSSRRQRQRSFGSESVGGVGRGATSLDEESDAGRRLGAPMLDTVNERKSEYGFDGFDINDQSEHSKATEGTTSGGVRHLDVEHEHRSSTSPKLPNLNRISGFGMDMFSSQLTDKERPAPATNANPSAAQRNETPLHSQPSIGLRSVVHQAFDRSDDSSVPPTPASRTGSGVRRTDSESTGTTGISPIMSRVSSTAIPERRNPDSSTRAIMEVVNEGGLLARDDEIHPGGPTSDANLAQPQARISGFKPGHRRDISTPSPGNSPARTPDFKTSASYLQGHEASPANPGDGDKSEHKPVRPSADREKSFRPSLPGGWTSYAASTQSDAAQQDSDRGQINRQLTPEPHTSAQVNDDDVELTPTTTKQALPQAVLESTLTGTSVEGPAAGELTEKHVEGSLRGPQVPTVPRNILDNDSLPTPDPAMAPGGNVYSKTPLDPRLLPKLEQAPAEAQLRPDVVHRVASAVSSVGPTPPPKDTPQMTTSDESDGGYFPSPTAPVKEKPIDQTQHEHNLERIQKPNALPILSTDTQHQNDENDRLRKEIVKQLSPQPSTSSRHDNSMLVTPGDEQGGQRESTYLPSEYDNYWATTGDDGDSASIPPIGRTPSDGIENANIAHASHQSSFEPETPPIPPLNLRRSQNIDPSSLPSLQPKFSWEKSAESVPGAAPETNDTPEVSAHNDDTVPDLNPIEAPPFKLHESMSTEASLASQIPAPAYSDLMLDDRQSEASWDEPEEKTLGRKSTFLTGGAIIGAGALGAGAAATTVEQPVEQTGRKISLTEAKSPRSSSYPVYPSPPEDEHPARSPDPYFPPTANQQGHTEPAVASAPVQQQPNQNAVPPGFKEIAGMASQQDRIAAFNSAREYFSHVDHGLQGWLKAMEQQHPEHADAFASRSKIANAGATTSGPLQQPYYQQYLNSNTSATPTSASASKPATGMSSSNTQQGFALPGGGKLTGQQVQAKGKELLHTAGIFGGKAGKAGKGLLAKGKSRFSKSGGGEKTSPPATTKSQRRSSWGPLKSLSHSSGQPDLLSQQPDISTAETTLPWNPPMRPERNSMPQFSSLTGTDRADSFREPHSTFDSPTSHPVDSSVSHEIFPMAGNAAAVDPQHERGLGVPSSPLQSHLSHDDVFKPNPIAENEEALRHDGSPNQTTLHPEANDSAQTYLTPRTRPVASERSNSDDTRFYSAAEDGSSDQEWIMVSPESDMKVANTHAPSMAMNVPAAPPSNPEPNGFPAPAAPAFASSTTTLKAPVNSEPELDQAASILTLGSPVLAVPTRPQEAEVLVEPELEHFPKVLLGGPSTETEAASVPPSHSLHHKRASVDLAERPSMVFDGSPPHAISRSPEAGVPPVTHSSNVDQPEVSPIRDVNPTASWLESSSKSHSRNVSGISVMDRPRGASVNGNISLMEAKNPISLNQPYSATGQAPAQSAAANYSYAEHQQQQQAIKSSFLPPIRRTSTFGIGFGSRQKQTRFPIEDDEPGAHHPAQVYGRSEAVNGSPAAYDGRVESQASFGPDPTIERASVAQSSPIRQKIVRVSSSDQSQRAIIGQPPGFAFATPGMENGQSEPLNTREPQDFGLPSVASPSANSRQSFDSPRNSWEPQQRVRGMSGSNLNSNQRPDGNYFERAPWGGSVNSRPFEQPPSSAQRYPELFKTGVDTPPRDGGDLPAQYYQQPIPREEAFLPRQHPSEYQLEGVGPPEPEQQRSPSRRRNSGQFFRELGGRLSRGTSRERNGSRTESRAREDGFPSPPRPFCSQENEYSASNVASEEGRRQNERRSSFFGNLNRASTVGLGPPQSQESVIAHHSGSRIDLLADREEPPAPEKKRSFFGSSSGGVKLKSNKLSRASTSGGAEEPGKKKRFSGLTGFFGKSEGGARTSMPPPTRPSAAKQLANNEVHYHSSPSSNPNTISPYANQPPNDYQQFQPNSNKLVTNGGARGSSQSRIFNKFAVSPSPQLPQSPQSTTLENKSKPRRPSAAGLLSGIIGRKSYQKEKDKSDDSRSQGSASQRGTPQTLPPAQTYTDLEEEERRQQQQQLSGQQYQQASVSSRAPSNQMYSAQQEQSASRVPSNQMYDTGADRSEDRGRRVGREPQYDNVPIPGGYNLVRGQGAQAVPTKYDPPRGLNQFQQQSDSRSPQGQAPTPPQHASPSFEVYPAQDFSANQYTARPLGHTSSDGFQQNSSLPQDQGRFSEQVITPQYQNRHAQHMDESSVPSPTVQSATRSKPPRSGALEAFDTFQARSAGPRISSEDLVARSPARLPQGQQRPYQLSLPDDVDNRPPPPQKDPAITYTAKSQGFPNTKPKHGSIQRLQNPVVRHPGSPASYPLPDSNFSPINPRAQDLPPPPPPGWEGQSSQLDTKYSPANSPLLHQNGFGSNMDRSNTHRTAASAISQVSHSSDAYEPYTTPPEALAEDKDIGHINTTRPDGSSPVITPERRESPSLTVPNGGSRRDGFGMSQENAPIKTTTLNRGPSPDLYDATPRRAVTQALTPSSLKPSPKVSPIQTSFDSNRATPIRMIIPEPQTTGNTLAPDAGVARSTTPAHEEKEVVGNGYAGHRGSVRYEMDGEPSLNMSATSYPGQEWNPYANGGYDSD